MRTTLLGALALILLAASPLGAQAPTIDGLVTEEEWGPYYLETVSSDWPHGDGLLHTAVSIYLAKDPGFWYLAFLAMPGLDGWESSCASGREITLDLTACGNPNGEGLDPECFDPYGWCDRGQSSLLISMSAPGIYMANTGDCPPGEGIDGPHPLEGTDIDFAYVGLGNGGCDPLGNDLYRFRLEMKIPKYRLADSDTLMMGSNFWTDEFTFLYYEPTARPPYIQCPCVEGTELAIPLDVWIRGGLSHECINLGNSSKVRVAILATEEYDPLDLVSGINCNTIDFLGLPPLRCVVVDEYADGRDDLVALYRGRDLRKYGDYDCAAETEVVTGQTYDLQWGRGEDTICFKKGRGCK